MKGRVFSDRLISAQSHKIGINSPCSCTRNRSRVRGVTTGSGESSEIMCGFLGAPGGQHTQEDLMVGTEPRNPLTPPQGQRRDHQEEDRSWSHSLLGASLWAEGCEAGELAQPWTVPSGEQIPREEHAPPPSSHSPKITGPIRNGCSSVLLGNISRSRATSCPMLPFFFEGNGTEA